LRSRDSGVEAVPLLAPPIEDIRDVLASSAEVFPRVRGVVSHPVFSPSGKLVSTPGYNAETEFYIDAGEDLLSEIAAMPEIPGASDVHEALEIFRDILGDFPFANPASYTNTLGLFQTILQRNIIPGTTPIFLVKAATPGTGKTLAVKIAVLAITGKRAALSVLPESEEELSKVLLSVIMDCY
jgi:hypothetical protein